MNPKRLPVEVIASGNGSPARLRLKGHWAPIEQHIASWVIQGQWWSDEVHREYMRVVTSIGAAEVYREGGSWWLSRVLD